MKQIIRSSGLVIIINRVIQMHTNFIKLRDTSKCRRT